MMWRILGKRPGGKNAYVTVDVTPEDDVAVRADDGDPVMLTPAKAERLWLALGQAIGQAVHRRRR